MILAKMHKMFASQVRGPGRNFDPTSSFPHVDPTKIAEDLSDEEYNPYLITSAISEMESQGLFSSVGEWSKDHTGKYIVSGGFSTALSYTDFCDLVEKYKEHLVKFQGSRIEELNEIGDEIQSVKSLEDNFVKIIKKED